MSAEEITKYRMEKMARDNKSFGELLGQLATDSAALVQNELTLAKIELGEKAGIAGRAIAFLVGAGLMGLGATIFFGMTMLELLALALPRWAAALIIALGLSLIAGVIALIGIGRLRHLSLKPKQTIETLEEDKEWLKKLA